MTTTPGRYRIRVKGRLDPSWSDRLGGMVIENLGTDDHGTSELTGPLTDQAALSGVFTALIDMRHEVLSVDRLPEEG